MTEPRRDDVEEQTDAPITPGNFTAAQKLPGAPTPKAAGQSQDYTIPAQAKRYVAIRALDNQRNVGRPLVVDLRASR